VGLQIQWFVITIKPMIAILFIGKVILKVYSEVLGKSFFPTKPMHQSTF
jgi:hypothetical protein